jgi:hypothetical protein
MPNKIYLAICLYAWNDSFEWIKLFWLKVILHNFAKELLGHTNFCLYPTVFMTTLHEGLPTSLCIPQLQLVRYLSVQTIFWTDIAQKGITQILCLKIYFAQALWFWDHSKKVIIYYTLFVLCFYIQIYLTWVSSRTSIHCTVFCFALTNINKCIHFLPNASNPEELYRFLNNILQP